MEYLQLSKIYVNNIHNKAGTHAMSINSTGLILPKAVAFQVTASNTDQTGSAGATVVVQWEDVDLDTGGYWDSSNHRYKPLIAGWYNFWGSIRFQVTRGQYVAVNLRKNGNRVHMLQINSTSGSHQYIGNGSVPIPTGLVYLNGSTDYVDVGFEHEYAATIHDADSVNSLFGGALVHAT